ncbi:DEAD/DEAH box helicase [Nakamurella endophytica]|uniref:RNA helicase n=1 Tax=Nakamurella endophytica TaxID=1748367 RepID=A0A917T9A9_9ACTN|nr:DEAD/DEAH box helicase [Nakamurella endophytica]GGM14191.1 DNA helicase [Nakamurella endophytica]
MPATALTDAARLETFSPTDPSTGDTRPDSAAAHPAAAQDTAAPTDAAGRDGEPAEVTVTAPVDTAPVDTADGAPVADAGEPAAPTFADLGLPRQLLRAAEALGYRTPTAIQERAIPALLAGRDITGVAQTGTGKTAAFGLPLLASVDPAVPAVQALVLAPTRELAVQVATALGELGRYLPDLTVVPVYGGAPFLPQRAALRAGAQVVVGTPGRIIDHLERGTLTLQDVRFLVLDEADEMLRMGFAEDVDSILSRSPGDRQTALFSATMPAQIRAVAAAHLTDPVDVAVSRPSSTVAAVRQTYAVVPFRDKVDSLVRVLAVADAQATIVFVRTKEACDTVGAELVARGLSAAAINGDVPQKERERIIDRLRTGRLDVLVATDVAARGLDVDRVELVVNFDAPGEPESYVHRIGRTGRAGREGQALTFFTPREASRLRVIERATRVKLEQVTVPTAADVAAHRASSVLASTVERLGAGGLAPFRQAVATFLAEQDLSAAELAATLLALAAGDDGTPQEDTVERPGAGFEERAERGGNRPDRPRRRDAESAGPRYRVAVGRSHGVRPAGIVGAITAEGGLRGKDLGRIDIYDTYSVVEIGGHLSRETLGRIGRARVSGQVLAIQPEREDAGHGPGRRGPGRERPARGHAGGAGRRTTDRPSYGGHRAEH